MAVEDVKRLEIEIKQLCFSVVSVLLYFSFVTFVSVSEFNERAARSIYFLALVSMLFPCCVLVQLRPKINKDYSNYFDVVNAYCSACISRMQSIHV